MKLKVCGLSKQEEVETCVQNKVSYCGFILNYPKSHRYVPFSQAQNLMNIKKDKTQYVGVLVNPKNDEFETFSKLNLDYFQLYGKFNNENLAYIKKKYQKKIISTIQVKNKEDVKKYINIESESEIILWDSSGYEESLNWDFNWIKSISTSAKKMLAGNITVEKLKDLANLADIIDVSGALETNKVKDINKIKQFITEIKKINGTN